MSKSSGIMDLCDALISLRPGAGFSTLGSVKAGEYDSENDLTWHDTKQTQPSDSEIDAEIIRLQAEWDANTYARNRKEEYPEFGSQLNKIYDDGLTKWKSEMVDPVKTKWPKNNKGPIE